MKRLKRLLHSKKGISTPLAVVLVLVFLMFVSAIYQFVSAQIVISGVQSVVQSATIAVADENYYYVFNGTREGYSGSYRYTISSWRSVLKKGDIYDKMDLLLGTKEKDGRRVKLNSSGTEYTLSGLTVTGVNALLSPAAALTVGQQFEITTTIDIEIPIVYFGELLPPIQTELTVKSVYMPKF